MLLLALRVGIALSLLLVLIFLVAWQKGFTPGLYFAIATFVLCPFIWSHVVVLPLVAGRIFIVNPREKRLIIESRQVFKEHPGTKIAVAGSYGKTSMKELLAIVLGEGLIVAATPANKNVAISHAYFARKLTGDEDVLVIEYGEGRPGDVDRFAETTHPDVGFITGLAPAHLDQYKTAESAYRDIFSLVGHLKQKPLYVNGEGQTIKPYLNKEQIVYTAEGVDGWVVSDVKIDFDGTSFTLQKDKQKLQLKSKLLGRHQIGPLSAAATLGLLLGLTEKQVQEGVAKTVPYEHRMQPLRMAGAWVIDDTYNGNIEGIRAGIALLKELPAKRKIYVTPGLVDQGPETTKVHEEIGSLLAEADFDMIVLMKNSATKSIQAGLDAAGGYRGQVVVQDDPLAFYTNLDTFLAAGDCLMMQNDWTDNYA